MHFAISMVYRKLTFMKFKTFTNLNAPKKRYFLTKILNIFAK